MWLGAVVLVENHRRMHVYVCFCMVLGRSSVVKVDNVIVSTGKKQSKWKAVGKLYFVAFLGSPCSTQWSGCHYFIYFLICLIFSFLQSRIFIQDKICSAFCMKCKACKSFTVPYHWSMEHNAQFQIYFHVWILGRFPFNSSKTNKVIC